MEILLLKQLRTSYKHAAIHTDKPNIKKT